MKHSDAVTRLVEHGIKPSVQRIEIMHYLMTHFTHPTVEEVYKALLPKIPTLSRTTVYNTLRMFSEHNAAKMITINEHRVCYDGDVSLHAHFICKCCRKVYDIFDEVSDVVNRKDWQVIRLTTYCYIIKVYARSVARNSLRLPPANQKTRLF